MKDKKDIQSFQVLLSFTETGYARFQKLKELRSVEMDEILAKQSLALLEVYADVMKKGGKMLSYINGQYKAIELKIDSN